MSYICNGRKHEKMNDMRKITINNKTKNIYSFLFDVLPDAGHVRVTLKLATMLYKKGHKVYYTNTSESVFSAGLFRQGIGEVICPGDLLFFTPDLVLLDYDLREKEKFYRDRQIKYLFVAAQMLNNVGSNRIEVPVFYLPPSGDEVIPLRKSGGETSAWAAKVKEDKGNVLIMILLEEEAQTQKLAGFYEVIKKSCLMNPQYKVLLLTNSEENATSLFQLPDNMKLCKQIGDLPEVLPLCDVALIASNLNAMIESIFANVPAVVYAELAEKKDEHCVKEYITHGLGVHGKVEGTTPEEFAKQIEQVLTEKDVIKERLVKARSLFERENPKLKRLMEKLVMMMDVVAAMCCDEEEDEE